MKPPSIVIDHFLSTKWSKKLFTINHYELQNGKCIVTQELSAYDVSCLITPMEAEENGCRLSPSAYVSEEYDLEIGVTDLDLEVLMCENSKLQAELEEIQDEFVETMGEFIRLKQEWEGC